MKVEVTWDALDVEAGRRVRDKDGCFHRIVVFEQRNGSTRYGFVREADWFASEPTHLGPLLNWLNNGKFIPAEFKS